LPLINRDRMRGGDLIAGTVVISLPKRILAGDLIEARARYSFTERQLQAYGAFELQVLEELLRRADSAETDRVLVDVSEKICRRIGWPTPLQPNEVLPFLREFYTAERAFLERAQVFGKARDDKHAQPGSVT
ncbi:MAG: RDD family protein, partial [Proteobacteria bacterium]